MAALDPIFFMIETSVRMFIEQVELFIERTRADTEVIEHCDKLKSELEDFLRIRVVEHPDQVQLGEAALRIKTTCERAWTRIVSLLPGKLYEQLDLLSELASRLPESAAEIRQCSDLIGQQIESLAAIDNQATIDPSIVVAVLNRINRIEKRARRALAAADDSPDLIVAFDWE